MQDADDVAELAAVNREAGVVARRDLTDEFLLGDFNLEYGFGNGLTLTSITSYIDRDILVIRDATALTASITGGSIGLPERVYTLDAPLFDATTAKVWTEELRLFGGKDRFRWLVGGFYSHTDRDYGQDLPVIVEVVDGPRHVGKLLARVEPELREGTVTLERAHELTHIDPWFLHHIREMALLEMKPQRRSPAHQTDAFAELVCSNSLGSADILNAPGILKEEMRRLNSLVIRVADEVRIPAGGALAVSFAPRHRVTLWARDAGQVAAMRAACRNQRYLPDIPFPAELRLSSDLDEALDRLQLLNRRQSEILEHRYFGGLSLEETAAVLGVSLATVKRELRSERRQLAHCFHNVRGLRQDFIF